MNESITDIIVAQKYLPTIASLHYNQNEREHYFKFMAGFIDLLNQSFNIDKGKALSNIQIDIIVQGTHTQFPYFRLNDVFKVVQGFMTGKYKVYLRLDPPMWFAACKEYDIERSTIQADYLEKYHHNIKFIQPETLNADGEIVLNKVLKILPPKPDKKKTAREQMREAVQKVQFVKELGEQVKQEMIKERTQHERKQSKDVRK